MHENLFELDVNAHEQKIFLKAKRTHKKVTKVIKTSKEAKMIKELETRIRDEIGRSGELQTWGMGNYVIEMRLRIRMTEDLIDLAQKCQMMPETHLKRELDIMKQLRDQTYDDLRYFVI